MDANSLREQSRRHMNRARDALHLAMAEPIEKAGPHLLAAMSECQHAYNTAAAAATYPEPTEQVVAEFRAAGAL